MDSPTPRLVAIFIALLLLALIIAGDPVDTSKRWAAETALPPPAITTMEGNMQLLGRMGR